MVRLSTICAALKQNQVETLCFNGECFDGRQLLTFSQALVSNKSLQRLSFINCEFDSQGVAVLLKRLSLEDNLSALSLSGSPICERAFPVLLSLISKAKKLHTLELSNQALNDEMGVMVADSIHSHNHLKVLNIECNQLGRRCATAFVKTLRHNQSLNELNLSSNSLEAEGVNAIFDALDDNLNLKALNLTYNCQDYKKPFGLSDFDKSIVARTAEKLEDNQIKRFLYHVTLQSVDDEDVNFWASKVKTGGKKYKEQRIPHTIYDLIKANSHLEALSSETYDFKTQLAKPSSSWSSFFGQSAKYRSIAVEKLRTQDIGFSM